MSKLRLVPENVPAELRAYDQWLCWRWAKQGEKWTKLPVDPHTGQSASYIDPAIWATFDEAVAYAQAKQLPGVGFVLTPDDPFTGIDLDDAINPKSNKVKPGYAGIVRELNSYTETSPGMTGIRIFVKGSLPGKRTRWQGNDKKIEMYDEYRFLTVTGWRRPRALETVEERQDELENMYRRHIQRPAEKAEQAKTTGTTTQEPRRRRDHPREHRSSITTPPTPPYQPMYQSSTDDDVVRKVRNSANGATFRQLYDEGDLRAYDGDHSRADLALCYHLAYWTTGDAEQIDRLFRDLALYREKWERSDYRDDTIEMAISSWRESLPEPVEEESG